MQLQVEQEGGVHIITPEGEMVTGEGDIRLRAELDKLLDSGNSRVILDFSKVPYIDSSVLGQLVHGHSQLKKEGGALKLVNPSKRILDLLTLTRLITIFEVYEDREKALESWGSSAG